MGSLLIYGDAVGSGDMRISRVGSKNLAATTAGGDDALGRRGRTTPRAVRPNLQLPVHGAALGTDRPGTIL